MIIKEQYVYVGIGGKNWKHYRECGYENLERGVKIKVHISDLTLGSNSKVLVVCDYCGDTFLRSYKSLLHQRKKSPLNTDSCYDCVSKKTKASNMAAYGVENVMLVEEHRDRLKKSNMEKYGVPSALCLPKNRKKLFETLERGSSQQKEIFHALKQMYPNADIQYNKSLSNISLDIYIEINGAMVDVEYDSAYWHEPQRDRKRDEFVKSKGISVLRIKSGHKIPDETVLRSKIRDIVELGYSYREIVLSDWKEDLYKKKARSDL